MIAGVRDWLPISALTDQVMRARCVDVVNTWSQRWSRSPALGVQEFTVRPNCRLFRDEEQRIGSPVELAWSEDRALDLAYWALAITAPFAPLTTDDRAVLVGLGEDIALDLCSTLAREFAIDPEPQRSNMTGLSAMVALVLEFPERKGELCLFLKAHDLVRYRKTRCATEPARSHQRLRLPLSVFPETEIEFQAVLGRSQLSLRDLRSAETGDVIKLDTQLGNPIELVRSGDKQAVMSCHFRPGAAGAVLTLRRPEAPTPG